MRIFGALSAMALDDFAAARSDLETVIARDPKYDYQRAAGLANAGQSRGRWTLRRLAVVLAARRRSTK